jgi:cytochrome b6-f complex iron-sulfur subunit
MDRTADTTDVRQPDAEVPAVSLDSARPDTSACAPTCGCSATTDRATTDRATDAAPGVTRRRVVTTTMLGAVAATALAACGGDDPATSTASPSAGETGSASAGGDPSASATEPASGDAIAKVADVPVGGAVAAQTPDGTAVILAQPTAGEVVAFDARCPHQGCTVAPAADNLACPCHGSTFKTSDGSVITGPATSGLKAVPVTVSGDDVVAG